MTRQGNTDAVADSVEVRERLVEALNLDLIGPWGGHTLAAERLPGWVRPSNWYLTGFLIPSGTKPEWSADADEEDDIDETPASSGLAEESSEERKAAKKGFFPSSMGLSFLVAAEADALAVIVRWGDYEQAKVEGADGKSESAWLRRSNERTVPVSLSGAGAHRRGDLVVPDSGGLTLHVDERPIHTDGLAGIPTGTRSVSVFLVNGRAPDEADPDRAYAFQAEIEVRGRQPFVPRPDPRGAQAADWDDQVADLHYADTPEYATGHGVSADWEVVEGACRMLRTAWIPRADVEETKTAGVPRAELSMDVLGGLSDGQTTRVALRALVEQYRTWIEERSAEIGTLPDARRETAEELLRLAGIAADRIERGIAMLAADADVLDAFRVANRAVARALRQRLREQFTTRPPAWRAFQLAFILLNVPGLADPRDPDRETVDLLFFPTGGGKTEAYLGLAALAMVLRRLRNPGQDGLQGAGVSVIMRYTLRLNCTNLECDFSGDRPLPVLAVDEPIYRRLPAFLIATVDKFASLPWEARTGVLLGGADRCDKSGFHGAAEPRSGRRLERPLLPPDLVIQDELHLISGPLGTMVGLYEAVIDALCVRAAGDRSVRPKIVASTATARQAGDQIRALFARSVTQVFPPPGPDRRDSFFARTMPVDRVAGRRYLGIASPGRNPKVLMRRVWLALMGAAERAYRDAGGHTNHDNPADPYMTVLGYFNSLRELGGARRILAGEVRNTLRQYGQRRRLGEPHGLFRDRRTFSDVVELPSRVSTDQVAAARRRLERAFHETDRVDCAIATNMISVGLDIPRLGLMVVLSQPKTHAEYIQARR